jgi:uncharacterized membrane protein
MKITNLQLLLLGIGSTLLFDIAVLSTFNTFYMSSAYVFLYLCLIPGLFIFRLLRLRGLSFVDTLMYIIGFSISFLFLVGISTNLLVLLPQMPHPLNATNSLLFFNFYIAILMPVAYYIGKGDAIHISWPAVTSTQLFFYVAPFFFPILSIVGAELLNRTGVNTLIMFLLFSIALYTLITSIFINYLGDFRLELPIYLIALSLLFMFSLRSSYVIGWDIYQEYKVFRLTETQQLWSMANFPDPYNACLSITILPTLYQYFTKVSSAYVFKVLFQIMFAIAPVNIYSVARRFADRWIAFLATFLFMTTLDFFRELPALDRQEIAYIFFGLILLTLFDKQITPLQKKVLFVLLSFSVVLAHYSTTYILIATFGFACAYLTIRKWMMARRSRAAAEDFTLQLLPVTLFIVFAMIWIGVITRTSGNIFTTLIDTTANLTNTGQHTLNTTITDQLFSPPQNPQVLLKEDIQETAKEYSQYHFKYYPPSTYKDYTPTIIDKDMIPLHVPVAVSNIVYSIGSWIIKIMKILIMIGFVAIVLLYRRKLFSTEYTALALGFIIVLLLLTSVPALSLFYPVGRLDQQTFYLAALPTVLSTSWLLRFIPYRTRMVLITTFFIAYALFTTTFVAQLVGGQDPDIILNNAGVYYHEIYLHPSEVVSIHWLDLQNKDQLPVFADGGADERMEGYSDLKYIVKSYAEVVPSLIAQDSYAYSDYSNTLYGIGIIAPKDTRMEYNFPMEFLNNNKNLIYNNHYTHVYR